MCLILCAGTRAATVKPGDDGPAIQKLIDTQSLIIFPAGSWTTGRLQLRSGVTIQLGKGTTLIGGFTAKGIHSVRVAGADASSSRILGFSEFHDSRGIQLANFTEEGPSAEGFYNCRDVKITGVTLRQPEQRAAGGSAIWLNDCRDISVEDCDFSSNDDVFCLKRSAENVAVTRTKLRGNLAAAFKIGTETDGAFTHISFTDSYIYNTDRGAISLESVDGSIVDGVFISNIRMENVNAPFFLRLGARDRYGKGIGALRNITIDNVEAVGRDKDEGFGSAISGIPGHPIENVTFSRIRMIVRGGGSIKDASREPPERPASYPEFDMFGRLPSYGIFARHVRGLTLHDFTLTFVKPDSRPALFCDDVQRLRANELDVYAVKPALAAVRLRNVRDAVINGSKAPAFLPFVRLEGPHSDDIDITGNHLQWAAIPPVSWSNDFRGRTRLAPAADPDILNLHAAQDGRVRFRAANNGDAGFASIDIVLDGQIVANRVLWLTKGAVQDQDISIPAICKPGEHSIEAGAAAVMVFVPTSPGHLTVKSFDLPLYAAAGKPIKPTVEVNNSGGSPLHTDVKLRENGTALATQTVDLNPGETREVSFDLRLDKPGEHAISIGDNTKTITINPALIVGRGRYPTLADALADAHPNDTIVLAPGTYKIPASQLPLEIGRPGIHLKSAEGAQSTILEAIGAGEAQGRRNAVLLITADNVTVEDLTIRRGVYNIYAENVRRLRLLNDIVEDSKHNNITLIRCSDAFISQICSSGALNAFLQLDECHNCEVSESDTDDPSAVEIAKSNGISVLKSHFNENWWFSIAVHSSTRITIKANDFVGGRLLGVQISQSSQVCVDENRFVSNKRDAILVTRGSEEVTVVHNDFQKNKSFAVANESDHTVQAQSNWWGDSAGPSTSTHHAGESIMGQVIYKPWLNKQPVNTAIQK